jgi:hypothetical protein
MLAFALVLCVVVGATLRFVGLGAGLRHPPHIDERYYIEHVIAMVAAGDLDHRAYNYPGGFFYLLAPLAWFAGATPLNPEAYLLNRGLVASVGVLNILVAFVVGSRLLGRWAGLASAAFLAVSPVDVRTCHEIRPDVLLETAGLLGLLAWRRVGESVRGDLWSGVLIGLAAAIKFTGLLMAPSYLVSRALAPGRRVYGALLAAASVAAIVVALTPYAILHAGEYLQQGPAGQLLEYYKGHARHAGFAAHLRYYVWDAGVALGPVAGALALLGTGLALRSSWRTWSPGVVHVITTFALMASAALVFPRLMLPALGVVYVLASWPVAALARRSAGAAAALLLSAVGLPLATSVRAVAELSGPSAADQGLDWIEAHVPAGASILETRPEADWAVRFGWAVAGDYGKYELLDDYRHRDPRALCLLAQEADVTITSPDAGTRSWARGLTTLFEAHGADGSELQLRRAGRASKPQYQRIGWAEVTLTASENESQLPALRDGAADTAWSTQREMTGQEWIELAFAEAVRVGRLELELGYRPRRYAPEIQVWTRVAGQKGYDRTPIAVEACAPLDQQLLAGRPRLRQRWVLDPRPLVALRISQRGARQEVLRIAEIGIDERLDAAAEACPRRGRAGVTPRR